MAVHQSIGRAVRGARVDRADRDARTVERSGGALVVHARGVPDGRDVPVPVSAPPVSASPSVSTAAPGPVSTAAPGPVSASPLPDVARAEADRTGARRRPPPVAAASAVAATASSLSDVYRRFVRTDPAAELGQVRGPSSAGGLDAPSSGRAPLRRSTQRTPPVGAATAVSSVATSVPLTGGSRIGRLLRPRRRHPSRTGTSTAARTIEPAVSARRAQAVLSAVLIVVGVLFGAAALPSAWIVHTVVDEDRFTQLFAGLSADDDVRDLVRRSTVDSVEQYLPVPLGSEAETHAAVRRATAVVLRGPSWQGLWRGMVRSAHDDTLAALRGDPVAVARTDREGGIGIRIGPAVAAVRERLIADGVPSAGTVPPVDSAVVLVDHDALGAARAAWIPLSVVGSLLPWLGLVVAALGIALARHRWRAVAVTAFAFAVAVTVADAVCNGVRDHLVGLAPSQRVADAVGVVVGTASTVLGLLVLVVAVLAVVAGVAALVVLWALTRVRRHRERVAG